MSTPDEEAVRAAEDATLASAEVFCKTWREPPASWKRHMLGLIASARRRGEEIEELRTALSREKLARNKAERENRELRDTLERVTRLALCALCGRVKDRHGMREDTCSGYFEPPWLQAALGRTTRAATADAGKGTP